MKKYYIVESYFEGEKCWEAYLAEKDGVGRNVIGKKIEGTLSFIDSSFCEKKLKKIVKVLDERPILVKKVYLWKI